MHKNAKQRIKEFKKTSDKRPELKLPKTGDIYNNFKGAIQRLCESVLESDISGDQKSKVAKLISRINIEL